MTLDIKRITSADTYELRHRILRPTQTLDDCAYPLDDEPDTCHIGAFEKGKLVGIGTIFVEAPDDATDGAYWRIRGMAVSEEMRGRGAGALVLQGLLDHAAAATTERPCTVWCNGRVTVQGFYERYGFAAVGDVFELPEIGPHLVFKKQLD